MNYLMIQYTFRLQDGKTEKFQLRLDPRTLEKVPSAPARLPQWTTLHHCRCINCPLDPRAAHCPAAAGMSLWWERFGPLLSAGMVLMKVKTPQRLISVRTTGQSGLASLLGLMMVVSGCPRTAFLKPLTRLYLPCSENAESVWRTLSSYLMVQYFNRWAGSPAEIDLDALRQVYGELQETHRGFAARLRSVRISAADTDGAAVSDLFSGCLPSRINALIEEIRHLFTPFLSGIQESKYL